MLALVTLIFAFQLVPLIKFCHLFARRACFLKKSTFCFLHKAHHFGFLCPVFQGLASLEYWMFPLRRYLVTGPLVLVLSVQTLVFAWSGLLFPAWLLIFFCFAVLISLWAEYTKIFVDLDALELLKIFPSIHPSDFFKRYSIELAYGGTDFFNTQGLTRLSMLTANFRHEIRASQSGWVSLKCLFDTYSVAQMAWSALRRLGKNYFDHVFDPLAALWGRRMMERGRVYLTVTGADQLLDMKGSVIFLSNHKSWFDFAVMLCAFSDVRLRDRRPHIRFVVPSNTSRWQRWLFCVTGLKKLVPYIPVFPSSVDPEIQNRVVKASLQKNFDLCLFPQEDLALPNVDRAQKRRDAGYFVTRVSAQAGGHLKSLSSELVCRVLDAAQQGQQAEDVHVVFTALRGTANILPSGSFRVQTEAEVNLNVGQVLTLEPQARNHPDQLTKFFDRELQSALGIHQSLIQRYLTELKGQFRYDDDKIELIKGYLFDCVKRSDVVFRILDGAYALPISSWNSFLSHLSQLLLERARVSQLEHLFDEVMQELLKKIRRN